MGICCSCMSSNTHRTHEGQAEEYLSEQTGLLSHNASQNAANNNNNHNNNNNNNIQQGNGQNAALPIAENEREAVASLLQYLEDKDRYDFFSGGPLRALTTLVYSDNINLQRSAALAFAEITEKFVRPVSRDVLEPILILLQNNNDTEVQVATCAALGNLAVVNENKILMVEMGALEPLINQMMCSDVEVQCNAVGCITNLATADENKVKIAKSGALVPLTLLAKSKHIRVQRNVTGALLNMTHSAENRKEIVEAGAIPVLVSLLSSNDPDVQYYCTTALSNIAVDEINRKELAATEPKLVSKLVTLMDSPASRVKCQATLALRNLASDINYQLEIVRAGGLPHLVKLIQSDSIPLVLASVACIRNISIHPMNEGLIVDAGFMEPLVKLLEFNNSEEIQCHAVSTLRNLAASSEKNRLRFFECHAVEKCKKLALTTPISVQTEISACFAILALDESCKLKLLETDIIDVLIPMTYNSNIEVSGNAAAALANLCSRIGTNNYEKIITAWNSPQDGISGFILRFLTSEYPTFEHIGLWTILQLLESHDSNVAQEIQNNKDMIKSIKHLAEVNYEAAQRANNALSSNNTSINNGSTSNDTHTNHGSSINEAENNGNNGGNNGGEQYDDASLELYSITQKILQFVS